MRPPISSSAAINDGAPSLRKQQYIQKEVLAQNRNQTILNSESDDFLCFKSQSERVIDLKRSESICENKPIASVVQNDDNSKIVNDSSGERNSYNFACFNVYESRVSNEHNVSSRNEPNIDSYNNHISDLKSAYGEQPNFKVFNQNNSRDINRINSETSPLLIHDQSKSITLIKNSASLIFTKKENNPVVHRRRDGKTTTTREQFRRSLPNNVNGNLDTRQQTFSWYAPVYSALQEESSGQSSRVSNKTSFYSVYRFTFSKRIIIIKERHKFSQNIHWLLECVIKPISITFFIRHLESISIQNFFLLSL